MELAQPSTVQHRCQIVDAWKVPDFNTNHCNMYYP